MPDIARAEITVDAAGMGPVVVNGIDVSDRLRAFHVAGSRGQPTRIVLEVLAGAQLDVDGTVETVRHTGVEEFLATIDPEDLEKRVLNADSDDSVGATVVAVLKELARASASPNGS